MQAAGEVEGGGGDLKDPGGEDDPEAFDLAGEEDGEAEHDDREGDGVGGGLARERDGGGPEQAGAGHDDGADGAFDAGMLGAAAGEGEERNDQQGGGDH